MSSCPVCGAELRLLNTPLLNTGRLANGEKMCTTCYNRLAKLYDKDQIHTLTSADVKQVFEDDDALVNNIITQIENTGINRQSLFDYWNTTELQYLPNTLENDETIVAFANGVYDNIGGIIVATNVRLFFLSKPALMDAQVTTFEWDAVDNIQSEVADGYGALLITYSGDLYAVEQVNPEDSDRFCYNVSANIPGFGAQDDNAAQQDETAPPQQDIPEQLEKYAALKDKGILTQEEFDAMKKKLLGL